MITTAKIMPGKRGSWGIAIIAENLDTRMGIKKQQPLPFQMATMLIFCSVQQMKLVVW